jgi:hypothetical protein
MRLSGGTAEGASQHLVDELQRLKSQGSYRQGFKPDLSELVIKLAIDGLREVEGGEQEVDRDGEPASHGPGSLEARQVGAGLIFRD